MQQKIEKGQKGQKAKKLSKPGGHYTITFFERKQNKYDYLAKKGKLTIFVKFAILYTIHMFSNFCGKLFV